MKNKKIKKKIPKSCNKCDYCRIDDIFGLYCSVVERWLPERYDNRPPFCPYEIAKKELNRCSNCSALEGVNGKTIYAWCPIHKWAFERGVANSEHSCCTDWRDDTFMLYGLERDDNAK